MTNVILPLFLPLLFYHHILRMELVIKIDAHKYMIFSTTRNNYILPMAHHKVDTSELIMHYPFKKKIIKCLVDLANVEIKSIRIVFDSVKTNNNLKYIGYSDAHQLDEIISHIINKVNDMKDNIKIKINIYKFINGNYELFYYFMQFTNKLFLLPIIKIECHLTGSCVVAQELLTNIYANKLVIRKFKPRCINIMNHTNYIGINNLLMRCHSNGCRNRNMHELDKFCEFLNKFPNLSTLDVDLVEINNVTSQIVKPTINPKKIVVNSIDILKFLSHSSVNNLSTIIIDLSVIECDSSHSIDTIDDIINNNPQIEHLKLTSCTSFINGCKLSESTIYNLQHKLPIKYIDVDAELIYLENIMSIAKNNKNLTHCAFYVGFTDNEENFIDDLISVLNTSPRMTSLEFFYVCDEIDKYYDFIFCIMDTLINFDIVSLKFKAFPYVNFDFEVPGLDLGNSLLALQSTFKIANNHNCLRHISIISDSDVMCVNLSDLLLSLVDNKTISTIELDYVHNVSKEIFSDTHFFDYNTSLCCISFVIYTIDHEGFVRNKQNDVDTVRLARTKVASLCHNNL
jgi:hypothetical protein